MKKRGERLLTASLFLIVLSIGVIGLNVYYNHFATSNIPIITGKASDVGTISLFVLPPINFTINLSYGWNFISFYAIMNNYSIDKVLEPIAGDYQYLQEWNSTRQDFNIWSTEGVKEFDTLNINKSYFIFMLHDRVLTFDGDYFGNWSIILLNGWETPDYVYDYESNVTGNTFYNATFYYMQKWDTPNQEFLAYSPQAASNPFNKILIAEGYLIRTDGGVLNYVRI
jgi:hypothetical protein